MDDGRAAAALAALEAEAAKGKTSAVKLRASIRKLTASTALSPSTSRSNYVDPRVVAAFCARTGLPFNRAYPPGLVRRFAWAAPSPSHPEKSEFEFCT